MIEATHGAPGAAAAPMPGPAMAPPVGPATIEGERHVSEVAGRSPTLTKKGGLGLIVGAGVLAGTFILLHGSHATAPLKPGGQKLQVKETVRYEAPPPLPAVPIAAAESSATPVLLSDSPPPLPENPIQPTLAPLRGGGTAQAAAAKTSPSRKADDRLLVFSNNGRGGEGNGSGGASTDPGSAAAGEGGNTELAAHLQSTRLTGVTANVLRNQPYLLTTGNVVPCILQTAMDSTLPGLVTCVIPQDVQGKTGLTLLDRGTRIVGESQGGVRQGQNRVFVLWTRAETPQGVVINLASPASDTLGRSGLTGAVDTHFWARFGGALMLTIVDGALKAGVAAASNGNNNTAIDTSGTQSVIAESLHNSTNIPPTIRKNQGELVSIFVARDLDFSSVYRVAPTASLATADGVGASQ